MRTHLLRPAVRAQLRTLARRTTVLILGLVASCSTATEILEVKDPDIVNPVDVQSVAGANAVRLGALARLNAATSGDESLFLLGGLFSDEWINGDSFIARQEIDQRTITRENTFLTAANRVLHRARLSAEQAVELLAEYSPAAPGWQAGEMFFVQAYTINLMAEHYCSGLIFSSVVDGVEQYGSPLTTTASFEKALALVDQGITKVTGTTTDDTRVRNALRVLRGRILVNLNRQAEAATAVNGVPNTFTYNMLHAATATSNQIWNFNSLSRRYSVSVSEGTNGLNFGSANDPRVPVCQGGDAACRALGVTLATRDDLLRPIIIASAWPARETPVAITNGIEARLIEAEAQLKAGNASAALATLNAARTTVAGLAPLTLAATPAAQLTQLFSERAFWFFGRGYRTGDLRRLIRQYGRSANTVFPTGTWHKGGNYGVDVNFPVPQAEQNNPNAGGAACIDRNP
jgi:starch-binding outer membrane protein, SusD/RagB family